ncbi:MAG: NUDIX hydrolase [Bacteroidota bacterium]
MTSKPSQDDLFPTSHLNPWRTITSKKVYENPWISVEHHEVITPTGSEGIYGKVIFKNLALGIIPIDSERYTWLVGQYRYTMDTYSWEIPMGGGPVDIDPLLSAQRELQEETGISADRWSHLMEIHTSNSVTNEVGHIYIAEGLHYGKTSFDSTEQLEVRRLPLQDAIDMVIQGEITDAMSVAGLLRVAMEKKIFSPSK